MERILKLIGTWLLLWLLAQAAGAMITAHESVAQAEADTASVAYGDRTAAELPSFSVPEFSLPIEAELAGSGAASRVLCSSRVYSFSVREYLSSLKEGMTKLLHREANLSHRRELQFPTVTSHRCLPSCGYYVFALRRILI